MAVAGRPGPPVLAVDVLEGAEGGEPLQVRGGGPVGGQPVPAPGGPAEHAVGQPQGQIFQPVDGRPVDPVLVQQAAAGVGQALEVGPVAGVEGGQLGHVLDAQVQRVAEHPAGGVVGARLGRHGGVQRVEQGEPRPQGRRGRQQPGQVAEVADAPAGPGADRVQLGRPAPGAPPGLQHRPAGGSARARPPGWWRRSGPRPGAGPKAGRRAARPAAAAPGPTPAPGWPARPPAGARWPAGRSG